MNNELVVQVAQRGVVTLPKSLREAYGVKVGDTYTIIDLGDGTFLFRRREMLADKLADELTDALVQQGETLESMLKALRSARESYAKLPAKRIL